MEKRTLHNLRKHLNKVEEEEGIDDIEFPISGIYIFSKMMEIQNKNLLEKISKKKNFDKEDTEYFIDEFNKINYQIPEEAENSRQEKLQEQLQRLIK